MSTFPNLHVSGHPLVRHKVSLLSDVQTDTQLFRALVAELTELLLYEATGDLPLRTVPIRTPMEDAEGFAIDSNIGLVPILRAGLGMVDPAVNLLPRATVYHLGIYRDERSHRPVSYYNKLPGEFPTDLMILLDPDAGDRRFGDLRGGDAQEPGRPQHQVRRHHRGAGRRPAHARRAPRRAESTSRASIANSTRTCTSVPVSATPATACSGRCRADRPRRRRSP